MVEFTVISKRQNIPPNHRKGTISNHLASPPSTAGVMRIMARVED